MRYALVLCLVVAVILAPATANTAVPDSVNYMGILKTPGGSPVPDGNYSVTFNIYDVASGPGAALWSETQSVTTSGGLFSTLLGSVTPLPASVFSGPNRFLGIAVGGDPEMSPRVALVTVPYSSRVETVDGAAGGTISDSLAVGGMLHITTGGLKFPDGTTQFTQAGAANGLPEGGGTMTGPIVSVGDPPITMGKANFGSGNVNSGVNAFVAGEADTASGDYSAVAGGYGNVATGENTDTTSSDELYDSTETGFAQFMPTQPATGAYAFIGGGLDNHADGVVSVVCGGKENLARYPGGAVLGGYKNQALRTYGVIVGGYYNQSQGEKSFIGGGYHNRAYRHLTTIGGGWYNRAGDRDSRSGYYSTIGGGIRNDAYGDSSAIVGGGHNSTAPGATGASIGGGINNRASGIYATIPGGTENSAAGTASFAIGQRAKAQNDNTFVWNDGTQSDFASMKANQFLIRASNGVGIGTADLALGTALDVAGRVRMTEFQMPTDPPPQDGYVLTTNGDGVGTWRAAAGSGGNGWVDGGADVSLETIDDHVGIGTDDPAAKLHIISSSTDIPLRVAGGNQTFLERTGAGITNLLTLYNPDQTPNNGVSLNFRGDDGATSSQLFAEIIAQYTSHSPRSTDFVFNARNNGGWNEQLRIVSNGNVGIGTATPAERLDVAGNVHASGLIGSGSSLILDGPNDRLLTSTGQMNLGRDPGTGDFGNVRVGIGTTSPSEQLEITGNLQLPLSTASAGVIKSGGAPFIHNFGTSNTFIGRNAGNFTMTGTDNTAGGARALTSNTTGYGNTASGNLALNMSTTGNENTASGSAALLFNTAGSGNTAVGAAALWSNTGGNYNTACGLNSLPGNTTGLYNTASGAWALGGNGNNNTATGVSALSENTTGNNNTAYGVSALGMNSTGNNNTALGYRADVSTENLTNATAIGANASVSASNCLVLGGTGANAVKVGIGTSTPTEALHVVGNIRIDDETASAGDVLTASDATGLASWRAANGGGWVDDGAVVHLQTSTDKVGIGTDTPNEQLEITGNLRLPMSTASVGVIKFGDVRFIHNFGTDNTFIGRYAGNLTMTGSNNTASGTAALYSNTTGLYNTAIGVMALSSNTTGSNNTALGYQAGASTEDLTNATAIGAHALVSASNCMVLGGTGGNAVNVGIGTSTPSEALHVVGNIRIDDGAAAAGYVLTASDATGLARWQAANGGAFLPLAGGTMTGPITSTGNPSITMGAGNFGGGLTVTTGNVNLDASSATMGNILKGGALFIHNFGTNNTFIGRNAGNLTMTGTSNTASGYFALLSNTTGHQNTASGGSALYSNTTGDHNTANGHAALQANTTGSSNTATGIVSLASNTTGFNNTAIGAAALQANTTGYQNTASGDAALFGNTTGRDNTAVGENALQGNTVGVGNTAIGAFALFNGSTGGNNTAIGSSADVSTGNLTNATAIGAGAIVDASNKIRLGNDAVTKICGAVGFTACSDRNKKENFRPVDGDEVLRKIQGLGLSSWNYIGHDPSQFRHYGPMAQDFFAAFGHDAVGTSGDSTTINSQDIEGIMMIAIQALDKRTEEVAVIKAENRELQTQIAELREMIRTLASKQK